MGVILLRLEGLMQSWGIGSRFTDRHTRAEPSKSGVIGLISSALGCSREENIDDLTQLKMAVRVDREGEISYDYYTVLDVLRADAIEPFPKKKFETVISRRFYIADACFLVGFEGDDKDLLKDIIYSLKHPKWPLFLGRKSFPPSTPICLTHQLIGQPLIDVMKEHPWQGRDGDEPLNLRFIYDCGYNEGESRLDVPKSFNPRSFKFRNVLTEFIPFENLAQEG